MKQLNENYIAVIILIAAIVIIVGIGKTILNETIEAYNECVMEQCPMCENINNTICIDECDAMCYVIGSG